MTVAGDWFTLIPERMSCYVIEAKCTEKRNRGSCFSNDR